MIFEYEVIDEIVTVCETQVESLINALTQECEQRIKYLVQMAKEEAQEKLGQDDVSALVASAGLEPKKKEEEAPG